VRASFRRQGREIDDELTQLLRAASRSNPLETIFRLRALTEIAQQTGTAALLKIAAGTTENRTTEARSQVVPIGQGRSRVG